jgi:hypothetical protein
LITSTNLPFVGVLKEIYGFDKILAKTAHHIPGGALLKVSVSEVTNNG